MTPDAALWLHRRISGDEDDSLFPAFRQCLMAHALAVLRHPQEADDAVADYIERLMAPDYTARWAALPPERLAAAVSADFRWNVLQPVIEQRAAARTAAVCDAGQISIEATARPEEVDELTASGEALPSRDEQKRLDLIRSFNAALDAFIPDEWAYDPILSHVLDWAEGRVPIAAVARMFGLRPHAARRALARARRQRRRTESAPRGVSPDERRRLVTAFVAALRNPTGSSENTA